jgi:hypothetical protein
MVDKHPKDIHNPSRKTLQRWDNEGGAPTGGRGPKRSLVLEHGQLSRKASEMVRIVDKSTHWLERAEEARRAAHDMKKDREAKQTMMQIADSYERLAKLVQKQLDRSK